MSKIKKNNIKAIQNRNRVKLHRAWKSIVENDNRNEANCSSEPERQDGLHESLRRWALEYNITRRALNALLKILILFGMTTLPNDSRTLLSTPRTIKMIPLTNGQLWYVCFKCCLFQWYNINTLILSVTKSGTME